MTTYVIKRIYADNSRRPRTIRKGVTLEEARAHCSDPNTSYTCRKTITNLGWMCFTKNKE